MKARDHLVAAGVLEAKTGAESGAETKLRTAAKLFFPGMALLLAGCLNGVGGTGPRYSQLPEADIYLLGEVHDNPVHHEIQAAYLRRLRPAAVAFEMLTPDQAEIVNQTAARGETLATALSWEDGGWPAWALYEPVFKALGDARVYGMALPGAVVRRAVSDGAAAVFDSAVVASGTASAENRKSNAQAFGLRTPLPDSQRQQREAEQLTAHCNMLPENMLGGMVEAQRLRDAAFSRTALQALAETGGPVAVITGSGHARRDWGMPVSIAFREPTVSVFSLGQLEDEPESLPPFDLWLTAAPAPREDPCAAFE